MALVSSLPQTRCHARSISLPSGSKQVSEFDEQLCRSQAIEASTSSSSIGHKLNGLTELYISFDNLVLLPTNQRAIFQECQNGSLLNELLDELLSLLDLCSTAKDILLMTRDSAQKLKSVLRRKRGDNSGLMGAVQEYQSQRRKVNKSINKVLKNLKSSEIKKNQETAEVLTMLKEVDSATFKVLESFFTSILGSKSQARPNRWTFVSKLIAPKQSGGNVSSERSEVEKVDVELFSLITKAKKSSSSLELEAVQKELSELDLGLQDGEEGLELVYRHLIKTRASLLNILNC